MPELDTFRAFRRLYERAAADGRGEALFGAGAYEKSLAALKQYGLAGVGRAILYFEFPFIGEPYMDLEVGYYQYDLSAPVRFEGEGAPFLQKYFDACADEPLWKEYMFGYTCDFAAAAGGAVTPSLYIVPPAVTPIEDYVPKFLAVNGFGARVNEAMHAFKNMPGKWIPHYAGAMVGRPDSPIRLGVMLTHEDRKRYSDKPEDLVRELEEYMGLSFTDRGKEALYVLADGGFIFDFQFDLYEGGVIGDGLGVSVNFGFEAVDPRKAAGFLENGRGGDMMRGIEKMGLADARWRKMDSACYAAQHIARQQGGPPLWVGEKLVIDGIKVRFKKGTPFLSKGYLLGESWYI